MSFLYGNLLCGEKVALNVPHILSRCASRRTTQDALAERAYANPATASQGEIPRTSHQRKEKHHPNLGGSKTGISSKMNIPTPCALKASFQIFGRGMRTHAHEGRERSVVKLRCLLNADQSRSGYVRRVRFLVRVTKGKKNTTRIWVVFSLVTRTGIEPMFSA